MQQVDSQMPAVRKVQISHLRYTLSRRVAILMVARNVGSVYVCRWPATDTRLEVGSGL